MAAPQNSGYLQTTDPTKPRSDAAVPFRDIIPSPNHPRISGIETHTALSWCESRRQIEAPGWLINRLEAKNLEKPYKGFTSDGKVREGLYNYTEDEGAPTEEVIAKTEAFWKILSPEEKKAVHRGEVTDDEIRLWSNPELYMNPGISAPSLGIETANVQQVVSVSMSAHPKSKSQSMISSKLPSPRKATKRSSDAASQMTSWATW